MESPRIQGQRRAQPSKFQAHGAGESLLSLLGSLLKPLRSLLKSGERALLESDHLGSNSGSCFPLLSSDPPVGPGPLPQSPPSRSHLSRSPTPFPCFWQELSSLPLWPLQAQTSPSGHPHPSVPSSQWAWEDVFMLEMPAQPLPSYTEQVLQKSPEPQFTEGKLRTFRLQLLS